MTGAGSDQASPPPEKQNPYQFRTDEELETFARGVIDDAMAKTATSPRQFAYYSMIAAKRIVQFVLANFVRKVSSGSTDAGSDKTSDGAGGRDRGASR